MVIGFELFETNLSSRSTKQKSCGFFFVMYSYKCHNYHQEWRVAFQVCLSKWFSCKASAQAKSIFPEKYPQRYVTSYNDLHHICSGMREPSLHPKKPFHCYVSCVQLRAVTLQDEYGVLVPVF